MTSGMSTRGENKYLSFLDAQAPCLVGRQSFQACELVMVGLIDLKVSSTLYNQGP